jgi:TolB protein
MKTRAARFATAGILAIQFCSSAATGIFEAQGDVGTTPRKGSVEYDAGADRYKVTGGGANIWASTDAFYFMWKRISGNVTISADVEFEGAGAVQHRKAVLMVRQGLEPDTAYADVALHGDGLTSLQFRPAAGAITQEIRSQVNRPLSIRIERRGNRFTVYAAKSGEEMQAAGPAEVTLQEPVYVGIGVCSHNAEVLETATFTHVKLDRQPK